MRTECPSPAALAAFVQGNVDPPQHAAIRDHVAECDSCYEVVSETLVLLDEQATAAHSPAAPATRTWRPVAAVAAGLLLAIVATWGLWPRPSGAERLLALADERVTLARVSGLPYREYNPTRGGKTQADLELLAEAARAREHAEKRVDDEALHALGLAYLLLEEPAEAIAPLERGLELDRGSWRLSNELAVALIESGLREDAVSRIARAVDLLTRALEVHPDRAEMLFNKALALELMGMTGAAIETWEDYLRVDPSSRWSEEAGQRLEALHREADSPEVSAEQIERRVLEELLPEWAREDSSENEPAEAQELAATAALEYERTFHDPLLTSVVEAARAAGRSGSADGLLAWAAARASYREPDLVACTRQAGTALDHAGRLGPTFIALTHAARASCHFVAGRLDDAHRDLRAARSALATAAAPSRQLLGQVEWIQALLDHSSRRPGAALNAFDRATELFAATGDAHREAALQARLCDLYAHLGRYEDALAAAVRAASGPPTDSPSYFQSLASLANASLAAGLPRLSDLAAKRMVALADHAGRSEDAVEAWLAVGRAAVARGRVPEAQEAFSRAGDLAPGIRDQGVRSRAAGHAVLELAELVLPADPARAASLAAAAETTARREGGHAWKLARLEASAARAMGDSARAHEILRRAVDAAGRERATLGSLAERDSLMAGYEALYRGLVRSHLDAGRPVEALRALDEWRTEPFARPSHRQRPGDPSEPAVEAVLRVFQSLDDELVIWTLSGGDVEVRRHAVSDQELSRLVAASVAGRDAGRLAELVLGGLVPGSSDRLVLLPDGVLSATPFAALPLPATGRPVIESFSLEVAPSLALWTGGERYLAPGCPLVIAGATTGGRAFSELKPLARLEDEVNAVASLHGCGEVVTDATAIDRALSRRPALVHFAGHSLAGPRWSGLLLSTPQREPEIVLLDALERWPLDGSIVVLSSCSGAGGRPSPTVGLDGPARALLSAGARSVIANLGPVRDRDALELSLRLHHHLRAGSSPADALRAAQLELHSEGQPPSAWGGWRVLAIA